MRQSVKKLHYQTSVSNHMTFTGRNTNHSFSKSYQLFM